MLTFLKTPLFKRITEKLIIIHNSDFGTFYHPYKIQAKVKNLSQILELSLLIDVKKSHLCMILTFSTFVHLMTHCANVARDDTNCQLFILG